MKDPASSPDKQGFIAWLHDFAGELLFFIQSPIRGLWARLRHPETPRTLRYLAVLWFIGGATAIVLLLWYQQRTVPFDNTHAPQPAQAEKPNLTTPVRKEPTTFKAGKRMPVHREIEASLPNGTVKFDPARDLVRIDDSRVWWESDHDSGDTEDDHQIHRAMEEPLRRLIELVSQHNATLKVQDSYRASGIHTRRSLHKEGRAVDLTCDDLGLEKLAKLTWAAGFDWVYYEAPKRGGAHIHASVQPY